MIESVLEVGRDHAPRRIGDLARLSNDIFAEARRTQIVEHLLAILSKRALSQPVTHSGKVRSRFARSKWYHPSGLTAALKADFAGKRPSHRTRLLQRSSRVIRQQMNVLRVAPLRLARAALVVNKHPDTARRQQMLHAIEQNSGVALRPMHKHGHRNRTFQARHDKPSRKLQSVTLKRCVSDVERLPLARPRERAAGDRDHPVVARCEGNGDAFNRAISPTELRREL